MGGSGLSKGLAEAEATEDAESDVVNVLSRNEGCEVGDSRAEGSEVVCVSLGAGLEPRASSGDTGTLLDFRAAAEAS